MNAIKTIIAALFMLCASASYAACDGSVVYQGRSSEVRADLYARLETAVNLLRH